MDADLVDQALGAVCDVLYNIVLAGIVHRSEHTDIALDVKRESVIINAVLVEDLLRHCRVNAEFSDLFQILVNNVGAAARDVEIRFHETRDERCKAADLSAGAQTEQMPCLLVLADLLYILGRKFAVVFRLIEIQCSIKITCKNLLHDSGLLSGPGPQTAKSSLTDALSFHILTCTSPFAA